MTSSSHTTRARRLSSYLRCVRLRTAAMSPAPAVTPSTLQPRKTSGPAASRSRPPSRARCVCRHAWSSRPEAGITPDHHVTAGVGGAAYRAQTSAGSSREAGRRSQNLLSGLQPASSVSSKATVRHAYVVDLGVEVERVSRVDDVAMPRGQPRRVPRSAGGTHAEVVTSRVVAVRLKPVAGVRATDRWEPQPLPLLLRLSHVEVVNVQRWVADGCDAVLCRGCADETDNAVAVAEQATQRVRGQAAPLARKREEGPEPHCPHGACSSRLLAPAALNSNRAPVVLILALRYGRLADVLAALRTGVAHRLPCAALQLFEPHGRSRSNPGVIDSTRISGTTQVSARRVLS
eukprot:scaffold20620_cov74-Phaeocystis_antarctica.AAC.10